MRVVMEEKSYKQSGQINTDFRNYIDESKSEIPVGVAKGDRKSVV